MTRRIIFGIIGLVVFLGLSSLWYQRAHAPERQDVSGVHVILRSPDGDEVRVPVDVADTDDERRMGLMFREDLPDGQGMVFVFDEPQDRAFWMKNTLIPLDILYFDGDGMFVSRMMMSPCTTPECPSYPSGQPAQFALEVNAGEPLTDQVGRGWQLFLRGQ